MPQIVALFEHVEFVRNHSVKCFILAYHQRIAMFKKMTVFLPLFRVLFLMLGLFLGSVALANNGTKQQNVTNESLQKEVVTVGFYLNDVQNIDLLVNNYMMDFYIWMRWKNPDMDPASSLDFLNHSESWATMITKSPEKPEMLPNGEMYQLLHIQGRMSRKMDLRAYPFDNQNLTIQMEDNALDTRGLVYVPEEVSINPELKIPGFEFGQPSLKEATYAYPTQFGYPKSKATNEYSRLTFDLPIHRNTLTSFVKDILPIWLTVLCSAFALMLNPRLIDSRFQIAIFSILSLIALQISNGNDLPALQYMNLMDALYVLGYFFLIALMAELIVTTRWVEDENSGLLSRAQRLDRYFGVTSLAAFLLINALLVFVVFD